MAAISDKPFFLLANEKNIKILNESTFDLISQSSRWIYKRSIDMAINEKVYSVFIIRTIISEEESIKDLSQDICIKEEQDHAISQAIGSIREAFDGPREKISIDHVLQNLGKSLKISHDQICLTEVAYHEIDPASLFINNLSSEFRNALETNTDNPQQLISFFLEKVGSKNLMAFFNNISSLELDPLPERIVINTLNLIRNELQANAGKVITYDGKNNLYFTISENGEIYIRGKQFAKGYDSSVYLTWFLNGGYLGAETWHDLRDIGLGLETIKDFLSKKPPFFVSFPTYFELPFGKFFSFNKKYDADGSSVLFLPVKILHMMNQVAKGLAHLHANGMIHGDVLPNNFFLNNKGEVFIADLEMVRRIDEQILGSHLFFLKLAGNFLMNSLWHLPKWIVLILE